MAMLEIELQTQPAPHAWYARRHAAATTNKWQWSWSHQQKEDARTIGHYMEMAYHTKRMWINIRKSFIAIKGEGAVRKDKAKEELFKGIVAERGYQLVHTPQGLIVRIMR